MRRTYPSIDHFAGYYITYSWKGRKVEREGRMERPLSRKKGLAARTLRHRVRGA